jgi:hypothetical protein
LQGSDFFDTGMPAVPFVATNDVLSPDRQNPFDNRFGNWTSFPVAVPDEAPSADRQDSLSDRFGNWTSSTEGTTPRNPNLPVPPPEPGRPLGIFSGKPMPPWTTPLPLERLLNNSAAPGNDDPNWFTTLGGLTSENPTPPAPPEQTGGSKPVRYLSRNTINQPQTSVFGAGAPAVPFASSDNPDFSGGLPGRLAAVLAGADPGYQTQPVPQSGGLLGFLLSGRR